VPANDANALAAAFTELLTNNELRLKLGQAAKQQAIEKHSWNRTATELETIMYGLLDNPSPLAEDKAKRSLKR
jgi:glycosyltransferase involved in cell wall biosynthesis